MEMLFGITDDIFKDCEFQQISPTKKAAPFTGQLPFLFHQ